MGRTKSAIELEENRQDSMEAWSGYGKLDTSRLLLIYARQSSKKQFVYNVQSAKQQTEDAIERAKMLGWTLPYDPNHPDEIEGRYLVMVENAVAKKTSGTLPIDSRPGLLSLIGGKDKDGNEVAGYINVGKASAVLCVAVDRLFRDEDGIDTSVFMKACRVNKCVVITAYSIYDFNTPYGNAKDAFRREAEEGARFVEHHIKIRMLGARRRKVKRDGKIGNGIAPVGLRVEDDKLVPTSHAPMVNWLHKRFQELDASRSALLTELDAMARRGEPLFPVAEDINPGSMFLTKVHDAEGKLLGWTVGSRFGIDHILGNVYYQGHLLWNEKVKDDKGNIVGYRRILKRGAFPDACIVDADTWQYAYNCLADYDLDGNEIERGKQATRYTHRGSVNNALLAGNRYDGSAIIGGVNGDSVYIALGEKPVYRIVNKDQEFKASILVKELDSTLEKKLMTTLKNMDMMQAADLDTFPKLARGVAIAKNVTATMQAIEGKPVVKPDDTLDEVNIQIAELQRKLDYASEYMDAEELQRNYARLARLKQRRTNIEEASKQAAIRANEQEQAKTDVLLAREQYRSWNLEHRRRFIKSVTNAVTLESLADGWMRLVIHWSELIGGGSEQCFIWRESAGKWTDPELETLKRMYPTGSVSAILQAFPTRTWAAIQTKGTLEKIKRTAQRNDSGIDRYMSLTDVAVVEAFSIEPGKRVQWLPCSVGIDDNELKGNVFCPI